MTTFVLAHGAGAGQSHPFMQRWQRDLATLGSVYAFEYGYMQRGRRAPERLPTLLETHREQVAQARAERGDPIVLIGKSMGSRVGCHLATEVDVAAVICLGYPLRSPKGTVRDQALLGLRVPTLFVQGTRDALCPLDLLETVRARMTAPSELFVVEAGDHSLQVTKGWCKQTGRTQADVDAQVFGQVAAFVAALGQPMGLQGPQE